MNNLLLGAHIASGALGIALGPAVMWQETQLLRIGKLTVPSAASTRPPSC